MKVHLALTFSSGITTAITPQAEIPAFGDHQVNNCNALGDACVIAREGRQHAS